MRRVVTQEEFNKARALHKEWISDRTKGKRMEFVYCDLSGPHLIYLDLSEASLSGSTFVGANLAGVNLRKVNLSGVNLSGVSLRGADLSITNLREANLRGANLVGADLSGADLREADLSGVNLSRVNLSRVNLVGTDLSGVNLVGTDLRGANLSRVDLRGADLRGADLRGANLSGADLSSADLSGANLSKAYLRSAIINKTKFIKADLSESNIQDTKLLWSDFTDANLSSADLRGSDFENTTLYNAELYRAKLAGAKLKKAKIFCKFFGFKYTSAKVIGADLVGADVSEDQRNYLEDKGAYLSELALIQIDYEIAVLKILIYVLEYYPSQDERDELEGKLKKLNEQRIGTKKIASIREKLSKVNGGTKTQRRTLRILFHVFAWGSLLLFGLALFLAYQFYSEILPKDITFDISMKNVWIRLFPIVSLTSLSVMCVTQMHRAQRQLISIEGVIEKNDAVTYISDSYNSLIENKDDLDEKILEIMEIFTTQTMTANMDFSTREGLVRKEDNKDQIPQKEMLNMIIALIAKLK